MAKRFTDSSKYKKAFMRGLPGAYKLFWDFLYHDCDHAGIWIVDFDIAQMYIGKDMQVTKETALELFNSDEIRIVQLPGGKKWFIPSFLEFQYGKLTEKNKATISVISNLKKLGLLNDDLTVRLETIPPESPSKGGKDKVKEEEKDKVKEKEPENFLLRHDFLAPKMIVVFKTFFPDYPEDENDLPCCFQIAHKIAKLKGWEKESVTNGKLTGTIDFWTEIVMFSRGDPWFKTRSISDFNKEFQRLIQKFNSDGTSKNKHSVGRSMEHDAI